MEKRLTILILLITTALAGRALPYETARSRALFLSDKMAYELNLSDRQYEDVYQVNFDYFLTVTSGNIYGKWWKQRNLEFERILSPTQYHRYLNTRYFYRPISVDNGKFRYGVYGHYRDSRHFYRKHPRVYSDYRGGRYFRPDGPPSPRRNARPAGPPPRKDLRPSGPPARKDLRRDGPPPRRDVRRDGPAPRRDVRREGPDPRREQFRKEERRREQIHRDEQRREQDRRAKRHNDEKRRGEWY